MSDPVPRTVLQRPRRAARRGMRRVRGAQRARGFTLIEIMVVVVIIGLLAAIIVPRVVGNVDKARVAKAKQDIQSIETALTMYKLDNFSYPSSEEGLKALVQKPDDPNVQNWREGGYLQHLPNDPWGHPYQYQVPPTHGGDYDLYSFGAAQSDQNDPNAEIGNWNLDN